MDLRAVVVPIPQVCELDIIFNFEKAFFMLDEFMLGGEVQETSKKNVLKAIAAQDLMQEVSCLAFFVCAFFCVVLAPSIVRMVFIPLCAVLFPAC